MESQEWYFSKQTAQYSLTGGLNFPGLEGMGNDDWERLALLPRRYSTAGGGFLCPVSKGLHGSTTSRRRADVERLMTRRELRGQTAKSYSSPSEKGTQKRPVP